MRRLSLGNDFDPESRINEYDLTLFVREEDERYTRFVETHYQRAWDPDEVIRLLENSGLEFLGVYGGDEDQPGYLRTLQDTDERMYFVARECIK